AASVPIVPDTPAVTPPGAARPIVHAPDPSPALTSRISRFVVSVAESWTTMLKKPMLGKPASDTGWSVVAVALIPLPSARSVEPSGEGGPNAEIACRGGRGPGA